AAQHLRVDGAPPRPGAHAGRRGAQRARGRRALRPGRPVAGGAPCARALGARAPRPRSRCDDLPSGAM
ncbi:MAG: hypothetical protein AVDCRST_MAG30-3993, partial [uncultured Solirubrobacteraceae bacterium]